VEATSGLLQGTAWNLSCAVSGDTAKNVKLWYWSLALRLGFHSTILIHPFWLADCVPFDYHGQW
jgi:hypothetical protein